MDCQVVTAVNAFHVLSGNIMKQGSPDYNNLCEEAGACYGSAISIGRIYNQLGLKLGFKLKRLHHNLNGIGSEFVIETNIWHDEPGYHSVAIIDVNGNKLRVANFRWETSGDGWIDREEFEKYIYMPNNNHWASRKIKLD